MQDGDSQSGAVGTRDPLDGVAAAPRHHRVLFENDVVRVVESVVRVGETTPAHTHLNPRVMYALSGSTYVRRSPEGTVIENSGFPDGSDGDPKIMWSDPTQLHTIENTGDDDMVVLAIEIVCAGAHD